VAYGPFILLKIHLYWGGTSKLGGFEVRKEEFFNSFTRGDFSSRSQKEHLLGNYSLLTLLGLGLLNQGKKAGS